MKVLVLVLIITNLVFFMWQYKTGELEQHETSVDLSQEPIMLSVEATQLTPNAPNTQVAQTPIEQGKDKPTSSVANLDKTPLNVASHTTPIEQGKDKPTPSVANLDKTPLNLASHTAPVEQGKDNPKKDSPTPEQTQCYQVGPFDDDSSYQAWRKQLTGLKTTLRPVSTHKQSTVSHLVYYPINGAVSVDLAIQMLQAHGIDEFYRLKDGEYRGNLSLGVFKSETNAINFHAQLLSRGIHAQLKPLYRNESLRYVFVEGPQAIAARSQTFKRTHPALTIKSAKGC